MFFMSLSIFLMLFFELLLNFGQRFVLIFSLILLIALFVAVVNGILFSLFSHGFIS